MKLTLKTKQALIAAALAALAAFGITFSEDTQEFIQSFAVTEETTE